MASAAKEIRHDECKVREGREDNEGADKGGERGAGADVDEAEDGVKHGTGESCVEGGSVAMVDAADPSGERRRAVAAERPKHAAGGDVAADVCAEHWEEDDDEEPKGAGIAVSCLTV